MRHNEIKKKVNEGGLADMAQRVEQDHEVQMARSDLYKLAKYSIKLHNMLAMVPESKGIEGWQQAKITKAADYISSVYHNLDYEMKFDQQQVAEKKKSSYKDGLSAMLESKKKVSEKSVSRNQQQLMGQAYALKKGDMKASDASQAVKDLAASMSLADLKDFASTKHKGLPDTVGESSEELCPDCGKPSWKTMSETEAQKGVDGKRCWKGYRRVGTKKKGGKTVDNCVKVG